MNLRVLVARVGDPQTHYQGAILEVTCSNCGHPCYVQLETLKRAAAEPYSIWCLECNHADPRTKIVYDWSRGRVFLLPPPGAVGAGGTTMKSVPWLVWRGGLDWECKRCGRKGTLPSGCSLTTLGRFVTAVMQEHAGCKEPSGPPSDRGTPPPPTSSMSDD